MHNVRPLVVSLAVVALTACGSASLPAPVYYAEQPVASQAWVAIPAEPSWVTQPPPRDGWMRFVVLGRSNLRSICATGPRPVATAEVKLAVAAALAPIVGTEDATRAADGAATRATMALRACREELLTRDAVPGNTLCTAWALWEVPIDDVVASIAGDKREAARAALTALPPVVTRER